MSQTILESSHVHEATSQRIVVGPYLGEGISSAGLRCRFQQTGHIVPAYRDEEDGRIKCLIEDHDPDDGQYQLFSGSTGIDFDGGKVFDIRNADGTNAVAAPTVNEVVADSNNSSMGFTALALAAIFSGYELAGMIVNLLAGMAGARWGFKATLIAGLGFQCCALIMLMFWQDSWNITTAIVYITISQVLNGIAKDLVKLGGKSVTKLVTPAEKQLRLFRLVSLVTGVKNSFKGVGYLVGAALLTANYYAAVGVMLAIVGIALPFALFGLHWELGRTDKKNATFRQAFIVNHNVGSLSLARIFLFASRDLWFEVTLPYFLRSTAGLGWSRLLVGVFLAIWIIVYGQVQTWAPRLILSPLKQSPPNKWVATLWAALLVSCPAIMAGVLLGSQVYGARKDHLTAVLVITVVLYMFCLLFAVNSAVHSYLIVKYAEGNKVATSVGVYYSANAGGRLLGTLLSGFLYTYAGNSVVTGFGYCFIASLAFVVVSSAATVIIRDDSGGLACGSCLQIKKA